MVPDRQKVRMDGRTDDAKTISLRLRRGIKNENHAWLDYEKKMYVFHSKFECSKSGQILDNSYFLFAASQDGKVSCEYHSDKILEIKCLYSHRDPHPNSVCGQKEFNWTLMENNLTCLLQTKYIVALLSSLVVLDH